MSSEDFGYLRDEEQSRASVIAKKALILGAVLFSISCFVYITINAYYFVYHDQGADVPVIRSPEGPIKVEEENERSGLAIKDMDKTVYDNLVSNRKEKIENINTVRAPVSPDLPARVKNIDHSKNKIAEKIITIDNSTSVDSSSSKLIKDNKIRSNPSDKIVVFDQSRTDNKDATKPFSGGTTAKENAKESESAEKNSKTTRTNEGKNKVPINRVQLVALKTRPSAEDYFSKLNARYPGLFSGLKYFIEEVNLGQRGTFFRLQIGNFKSQIEAEEFCSRFIAETRKGKGDCIIVE